MTMMIVTHEMKFAREVSNRVFYMDEAAFMRRGSRADLRSQGRRHVKCHQAAQDPASGDPVLSESIIPGSEQFKNYCTGIMEDTRDRPQYDADIWRDRHAEYLKKYGKDPETYPISLVAEYSKKDDTLTVEYYWGGARFDPMTEGDGISAMIVSRLTKDLKYSYDGKNHISILL